MQLLEQIERVLSNVPSDRQPIVGADRRLQVARRRGQYRGSPWRNCDGITTCEHYCFFGRREGGRVDLGPVREVESLGDPRCQQIGEAFGIARPVKKVPLTLATAHRLKRCKLV